MGLFSLTPKARSTAGKVWLGVMACAGDEALRKTPVLGAPCPSAISFALKSRLHGLLNIRYVHAVKARHKQACAKHFFAVTLDRRASSTGSDHPAKEWMMQKGNGNITLVG